MEFVKEDEKAVGYFLMLWGLTFILGGIANTVVNASQMGLFFSLDSMTRVAFVAGSLGLVIQMIAGLVLIALGMRMKGNGQKKSRQLKEYAKD